jgi:cell division ATPase FtsA
MSLFSIKKSTERIGAIIDIGSGSVLVAIVISHTGKKKPTIVWSHREQAPLRNIDSLDQSAKSVMTSLINALLRFDSEGRRALHDYNKRSNIDEVQCCISAPWAYTVTKTISYNQDQPFEITKALVDSLVESAEKSTQSELVENEAATELGLRVITRSTLDTQANGYRIANPLGDMATELAIAHVSVVTQQYLIDHLKDLRHKIFSDKPLHQLSYMLSLYSVVDGLFTETSDHCLIDITYEATEIGIVRDGRLSYSTHIPFGSFSLAREIAHVTSLPLTQAFQSLHTNDIESFLKTLTNTQRNEVETIFEQYVKRLDSLFAETGDELSMPKRIYVHTDQEMEKIFENFISRAALMRSKGFVQVKSLSSFLTDLVTIENKDKNTDTAMLVAAKFFHTENIRRHFEYL